MTGAPRVDADLVQRFAARLDSLISPGGRLGVAVSGGPDSLALLLLSAAARPGQVEAATVDHGLRPESADEAAFVASVCEAAAIPHTTLLPDWVEPPLTAVQEQARAARYGALGRWASQAGLAAVVTAHHADDQAETLLMRLSRGAGVRGLAAMRPASLVPGHPSVPLLRPLLEWRKPQLEAVCAAAGLSPAVDPGNIDPNFERARVRTALAEAGWLKPDALARSAANLACADEALDWAAQLERVQAVEHVGDAVIYRPSAPPEIRRRVAAQIIAELANEGGSQLRGRELDRVLAEMNAGRTATLRGVRCAGGEAWSFTAAAPRRR